MGCSVGGGFGVVESLECCERSAVLFIGEGGGLATVQADRVYHFLVSHCLLVGDRGLGIAVRAVVWLRVVI